MFKQFKDSAVIYRQTYQGDKSSYTSTGNSCLWYLHPLSPERNQIGIEKFGKEFAFSTVVDADIKENDKLLIDSTYYVVKGQASYTGIRVKFKRVNVVKQEVWL